MANESDTTPIHNVYAQRFAADLETNRKEQELVSVQITELEVRLAQLKSDENWLLGIQGTLPSDAEKERAAAAPATVPADDTRDAPAAPATPAASATGPASGGVPKPRQARKATGTTSRARTAAPAKKASAAAPADVKADAKTSPKAVTKAATKAKATTRKAAAPKPPAAATVSEPKADKADRARKTGKAAEPPLRELVLALLVGAAEPRLVSEVASALVEAHPGRPTSTQVVRNALEALAKKGSIEKEHKQGSVMYTAPRPAAPEPAPAPAAEPVAEPVTAPETVAAEV
ncbi:hypothetical protein Slala03_29860 [Streptomyces lavendulae subsp. lavendulae]|uniref:hypothetical protein n=1 Tax=Streptomyces lavendulae TaxID=1914 RepID=UPI0024A45551|nr:hypothetical protein [Streptomyces lavendulae]GLV83297.1 hypothetical protein Slala03_29860 [Streptomyces lavendulae subsp. lavendulae]